MTDARPEALIEVDPVRPLRGRSTRRDLAGSPTPGQARPGQEGFSVLTRTGSVLEAGRVLSPWGMLAAIDLHGCERAVLADPETIRAFVPAVVDAIGMTPHGPLHLERFGDGELEGWSAMQFIETSSITIHADEFFGRCFVDVFSCRPFDPDVAAAIAVAYFGGTPTVAVLQR